jgi:hypothetical protein
LKDLGLMMDKLSDVPEEYRLLKINKLSNDDNDDDYQSPK